MIKVKLRRLKNWYCRYGIKLLIKKLIDHSDNKQSDYEQWLKKNRISKDELERQRVEGFADKVIISIAVPLYQTPEKYLCAMIESVQNQSYGDWELCIADGSDDNKAYNVALRYAHKDKRIKIQKLGHNYGIAENTNIAIAMCTGEYIGVLDHDDTLAPEALYEIRKSIQNNDCLEVIYTDEDKVSEDGKTYFEPHFKSDFNKELLCSNNYICHFFVVKRELFCQVGGFRKEFEGAQDYDFILRCTEVAENIVHIDRPLYHWRSHVISTAENPESKLFAYENGRRAIETHLERQGEKGVVEFAYDWGFYHVKYKIRKNDKVTIIVFGYNQKLRKMTNRCIRSIKRKSGYENYEICIIKDFNDLRKSDIRGEYILFINCTVSVITHNWLRELLGCCQRKGIGAVGVKLYNRDDTVRHAGIISGMKGYAFEGMPRVRSGYFHRDDVSQNLNGVTVDFLMMSRKMYEIVSKENPNILNNERKLCEAIRKYNRLIVYNPWIEAYIRGESSRAVSDFEERDMYYNVNLELDSPGYRLKL